LQIRPLNNKSRFDVSKLTTLTGSLEESASNKPSIVKDFSKIFNSHRKLAPIRQELETANDFSFSKQQTDMKIETPKTQRRLILPISRTESKLGVFPVERSAYMSHEKSDSKES
jgi:hypothetical protein